MMSDEIYMAGADVGPLEEKYVLDAVRNGWYEDKYYYVEKFESEFAKYHDRKYALMTPNCTSAIHLVLAALGVGSGDEVIVPDCTWIASAVSSVHLGAEVVFCDIEEDTWCLDPKSVRKSITEKTKAIIVVDLFGNMANWDELQSISDEYGIPLIEDAAEALGSQLNGKRAGSYGLASTFSFHNTKTISTGEGGMLLLDDDELFDRCMRLRDLGRGPETKAYFNELVGYKFMPFNIQAAIGLAQFERIDELVGKKRDQFKFYKYNLQGLNLQFNHEPSNVVNGAWITAAVFEDDFNRDSFISKALQNEVPIRPFFYPLSSIPAFDMSDKYSKINKNCYSISRRGINLPCAFNLTEEQMHKVCDTIRSIL